MADKHRDRLHQIIEDKHHSKESDYQSRPSKKVGRTHRAYTNMKHAGSNNKEG